MAAAEDEEAEGLDEGRFADPRHARDAETQRPADRRDERRLEHRLGGAAVIGARRFDEGDGTRQRPPVAGTHGGGEGGGIGRALIIHERRE